VFFRNLSGLDDGKSDRKSPNSFEKYLLIDIGSNNGVKVNQAAVYSGGMLLGKVTQVYEHTSKVSLLTSSESSINAITQTSRSNGVVKGQYSTGVRLEMINQNEELKDGELIITSGLEEGNTERASHRQSFQDRGICEQDIQRS